ncbi:hypothetical protein [Zhouia amylolytica]|nr:hypothetical protein [Zhouia amylolytica]MCQ0110182.1 hypothetical protein [Zhouia amylolytica]
MLKFKVLMKLFYAGIRIFVGAQLMFAGYGETVALNELSSNIVSTSGGNILLENNVFQALLICLPFIKFGLGLFLLPGFFTKPSLIAGLVLFGVLTLVMMISGNSSEVIGNLFYLTFFAGLLKYLDYNNISLDNKANLTCRSL